jgi:hypothetical protein
MVLTDDAARIDAAPWSLHVCGVIRLRHGHGASRQAGRSAGPRALCVGRLRGWGWGTNERCCCWRGGDARRATATRVAALTGFERGGRGGAAEGGGTPHHLATGRGTAQLRWEPQPMSQVASAAGCRGGLPDLMPRAGRVAVTYARMVPCRLFF